MGPSKPGRKPQPRLPPPPAKKSNESTKRTLPGQAVWIVGGLLLALGSAHAYRFYGDGRTADYPVPSKHAQRWDPEVWGPGETLVFDIAPDADFEVYFDSPEGVIPYVERAMASWSAIPTADIAWRVSGVSDDNRAAGDGRNTIFVDEDDFSGGACGGYASGAGRWTGDRWRTTECDIALCRGWTEIDEEIPSEEVESYREAVREGSVGIFVHEFGHCLGLAHAGRLSTTRRWSVRGRLGESSLIHPRDPAMAYGISQEAVDGLSRDDLIGASLLRPARGWERTIGTIAGTITVAGEPAWFAHVWALPAGGDPLRERIGVFTNADGEFLLEGLEPGEYSLWAQPPGSLGAHRIPDEVHLDLDDALFGHFASVRARRTSDAGEFEVVRGRTLRAPPGEATAAAPGARTPIGPDGITPCRGLRVLAERPVPADGPLWFTRGDSRLRDDRWFGATLSLEWSSEAGSTLLDWTGPYRAWWWNSREDVIEPFGTTGLLAVNSTLDVSIGEMRIAPAGSGFRQTMEIAWPESTAATMRFRSPDGACEGEPLVTCDISGCYLIE